MKAIDLGRIQVPVDDLASQGNAVLGIRGSGKSYTGTYIAERLLDAGVPIVAFDPIGIWRYLRVPAGSGREGYRVVVAGGEHGDIPLPPHGAAEIMRAALRDGISIVFDLYDVKLSKADWRRIVEAVGKVLLFENKQHGLRHIFLEEAAEFVPQRITDQGGVYSVVERLVRMGGNAQLGVTLINQRAEEVNKAVLDLCDLLILHRQKGRNSLINLSHWLDAASVSNKTDVSATVPGLQNGECYVWPAGTDTPTRTKIPAKRTFHPDRKAMQKAVAAEAKRVDVTGFVESMRGSLEALTKEAEQNDPQRLRARIAELEREARKPRELAVDTELLARTKREGFYEGIRAVQPIADRLSTLSSAITEAIEGVHSDLRRLAGAAAVSAPPVKHPAQIAASPPGVKSGTNGALDRAQRAFLTALAQQARPLTRNQVAIFTGYSATSRHVDNVLAGLRSSGYVEGGREAIQITAAGVSALGDYERLPTGRGLQEYWIRNLDKAASRFLNVICAAYPNTLSRAEVAIKSDYSPDSRHVDNTLAQLRSRDLIRGPRTAIRASQELFG